MRRQSTESGLFVLPHEAAVAEDVGTEHSGERTLQCSLGKNSVYFDIHFNPALRRSEKKRCSYAGSFHGPSLCFAVSKEYPGLSRTTSAASARASCSFPSSLSATTRS